MSNRLMRWFDGSHLMEDLKEPMSKCRELAQWMDENLPESDEKTAGLRKLVESKDCFIRAWVEWMESE